jgi:hypothetical protein
MGVVCHYLDNDKGAQVCNDKIYRLSATSVLAAVQVRTRLREGKPTIHSVASAHSDFFKGAGVYAHIAIFAKLFYSVRILHTILWHNHQTLEPWSHHQCVMFTVLCVQFPWYLS